MCLCIKKRFWVKFDRIQQVHQWVRYIFIHQLISSAAVCCCVFSYLYTERIANTAVVEKIKWDWTQIEFEPKKTKWLLSNVTLSLLLCFCLHLAQTAFVLKCSLTVTTQSLSRIYNSDIGRQHRTLLTEKAKKIKLYHNCMWFHF